ncbi:MAG: ketosteroid isomerase [Verrucomicrobiales bacterium]|nr:ketosteroid isomerase [Verrucomicrobiales bacterium]
MSTTTEQNHPHSLVQTTLPEVILNYIAAANDGRIEDAATCFAEDALVNDESRDHHGREAIRKWINDTTREFQPKNEVLSANSDGDTHTVISKISGDFPGSPIDLKFRFDVTNGKISHLIIQ